MSRLRKLFGYGRTDNNSNGFHPDRPPPEPYPAPNPYQPSSPTGARSEKPPQYPPPPFEPLPDGDDELPPPSFHGLHLTSPTSNAPSELADAAWAFTDANALAAPARLTASALAAIARGDIGLAPPPPSFRGLTTTATTTAGMSGGGAINVASATGCRDCCLVSALPLYAAGYHYPPPLPSGGGGGAREIYFEVAVERVPAGAAIAIGFVAPPYPGFRLPGWNRGSVAVHGDDGRRYSNDAFGGKDFVRPFADGQTVGLGISFGPAGKRVWFTRDGAPEAAWRLDELRDSREENDPLPGLDGACDVYAAVGIWGGGVKLQIRFHGERGKAC